MVTGTCKTRERHTLNSSSLIIDRKTLNFGSKYGQHILSVTCVLPFDFANIKGLFFP